MSGERRMRRNRRAWMAGWIWLAVLVPQIVGAQDPLPVVASIFPVADLARSVGGDRVSVSVLLPPGASPHTFDPKPSHVRSIARARVLFEIGAGLEHWTRDLVDASGAEDLRVVALSEGIPLLGTEHDLHGGPGHSHDHGNPHVWLDPVHAITMVRRIAAVLGEVDPGGRGDYDRNALEYIVDLVRLHEEIRERVAAFETRKYVAFHSAWAYFAQRYQLEPVGVIEESPGKEPTPRHLEAILSAIRESHVPAVFAEPQLHPKAAEVIAREAGVEIALLDPLGGEGIEGRDSYLNLMRYNVSEMERVLGK